MRNLRPTPSPGGRYVDLPGPSEPDRVARVWAAAPDRDPDGLAGDQIPLAARVAAVAAVHEALRSRRPHRMPLSHARAMTIHTAENASLFDPKLLAAFTAAARFVQIHHGG